VNSCLILLALAFLTADLQIDRGFSCLILLESSLQEQSVGVELHRDTRVINEFQCASAPWCYCKRESWSWPLQHL
jgi:hypothetical protein